MSKQEVPVVVKDVDEVGRGEREVRQVRVVIVVKLCQTGKRYQTEYTPLTLSEVSSDGRIESIVETGRIRMYQGNSG